MCLTILISGIVVYTAYSSIVPLNAQVEGDEAASLSIAVSDGTATDTVDSSCMRSGSATIRFTVSESEMVENPMSTSCCRNSCDDKEIKRNVKQLEMTATSQAHVS
jgi:hypothetical protein